MTQKRKRYDKQFKMAAARVVLGGEMRAVDLARELGIEGSTLRLWAQEYEEMGEDARARAGERQGPQDEGGGEGRRARIHRALLQQAEDALIDRL